MGGQGEDLQFERAEFAASQAGAPACGFCQQPLHGSYYQVTDRPACERCKAQIQFDQASSGSGFGRFARAVLFGFLAALGGSALWYAVRAGTGYEVGLIAVVVGLMVGGAVRAGSRRRGGPLYQALAVALTYFGICAQYVPDVWKAVSAKSEAEEAPAVTGGPAPETATPAAPTFLQFAFAVGVILGIALAAPFLGGLENAIGILIIGFALWEAWKLNKYEPLTITGPFRVGHAPAPASPAAG